MSCVLKRGVVVCALSVPLSGQYVDADRVVRSHLAIFAGKCCICCNSSRGTSHPGMLFDSEHDPSEANNLIDDPYKRSMREELGRLLAEWQARTPDDGKRDVIRSFRKK